MRSPARLIVGGVVFVAVSGGVPPRAFCPHPYSPSTYTERCCLTPSGEGVPATCLTIDPTADNRDLGVRLYSDAVVATGIGGDEERCSIT